MTDSGVDLVTTEGIEVQVMNKNDLTIHKKNTGLIQFLFCLMLKGALLTVASFSYANEFDEFDSEDEVVTIYLKKIRDNEGNYLVDVTKAAARAISRSGEFHVRRYKSKSYVSGPIVSVQSPQFTYAPYKDGMSRKEIASAGLALATDVGELFGFSQKARKAREAQARMENPEGLLSRMSEKQEVLVTMQALIEVVDNTTGDEVVRKVKFEQVFDNKNKFLESKKQVIETEVVSAIKVALVEYIEDIE